MNLKRKYFVTLLTIMSLATHLNCLGQDSLKDFQASIAGNWIWEKTESVDRGGGGIYTPETCNCTREIRIFDNGIIENYENNKLEYKGYYNLREIEFLHDPIKFHISSDILNGEIRFTKNGIVIGDLGVCGIYYYFIRKTK